MATVSKIVELIKSIGVTLSSVVQSDTALYAVYLFSFFFGVYALVSFLLPKTPVFRGEGKKPAKVVAFMIAVFVVGGIFYGTGDQGRTPHDLVLLFNGFGGFLLTLILASAFIAGGYFLYKKEKEQEHHSLSKLYFSLAIYISTSLLIPHFIKGGYVFERAPKYFQILGETLETANLISMIMLVWFTFALLMSLFKSTSGSAWESTSAYRESIQSDMNFKSSVNKLKGFIEEGNKHINVLKGAIGVKR